MNQTQGDDSTLKIGEVASRAGVSVDAVRFYERAGLVEPMARTASGYRVYDVHAAQRVKDLKTLQAIGLTLDEISEVFERAGERQVTCEHVSPLLDTVIERLDAKISSLTELRAHTLAQGEKCRNGTCGRAGAH